MIGVATKIDVLGATFSFLEKCVLKTDKAKVILYVKLSVRLTQKHWFVISSTSSGVDHKASILYCDDATTFSVRIQECIKILQSTLSATVQ